MSNLFTQDPLILDTIWTANSIPAALTNGSVPNQTFRRAVWENSIFNSPTAECVIQDINGNVILSAYAGDFQTVLWDAGVTRKSLLLKTGHWVLARLDTGKLYLYR